MSNELQTQKQEVATTEGVERTRETRVYQPAIDIYSENDNIIILVDMPGVEDDDVDIMLEKNILSITGYVKVSPSVPEGYELLRSEYGVGDYQRSFTIPDEIDRNGIEATMSKGVLQITLPKVPEAQAKKITVKAV